MSQGCNKLGPCTCCEEFRLQLDGMLYICVCVYIFFVRLPVPLNDQLHAAALSLSRFLVIVCDVGNTV